MSKEKKVLLGYTLENPDKLYRCVFGSGSGGDNAYKGVGESATDETKLAEYDRIGGYITKGGKKVKNGSFWDFELKKRREEPEVYFEYRVGEGSLDMVHVKEGDALPGEVEAEETVKKIKLGQKSKKKVNK